MRTVEDLREQFKKENPREDLITVSHVKWLEQKILFPHPTKIDEGEIAEMYTGWEKHEPSPIEFYHGELMDEFHKWRKERTNNTTVEMNGKEFNEIVVKAKKTTYEKYKKLGLDKIVLKTDLI